MPAVTSPTPFGRALRNVGWLLTGKGVGAVLSLVYLALATRSLGVAGFGQFSLVLGTGQAAAALVTAEPGGLAIERPFGLALPDSEELIRWDITDRGFAMHLGGAVPGRIGAALALSEDGLWLRQGGATGAAVIRAARSNLDGTELSGVTFLTYDPDGSPREHA